MTVVVDVCVWQSDKKVNIFSTSMKSIWKVSGAPVELWYLPFLSKITNLSLEYHQITTTFSLSSFYRENIPSLSHYPKFVRTLSTKNHNNVLWIHMTFWGQENDFKIITFYQNYPKIAIDILKMEQLWNSRALSWFTYTEPVKSFFWLHYLPSLWVHVQ